MLPNNSMATVHRWGTGHKRCPARALRALGALTFPPNHRKNFIVTPRLDHQKMELLKSDLMLL